MENLLQNIASGMWIVLGVYCFFGIRKWNKRFSELYDELKMEGGVMERLTFEGNFCDIAQCRELPCPYNGACSQRKVWERLAAYEDTGLEPEQCENAKVIIESAFSDDTSKAERIRELLKADRDGRLVALPCKVGGTVYRLQYIEQTPGRFVVGVAEIKFALIWLEEFGKTVFLTREEAEKALEAMKDGQ